MTRYGFTGSRNGFPEWIIHKTLDELGLKNGDTIITGACKGVDSQVSYLAKKYYPFVEQLIIVPGNEKNVDRSVYKNGEVRKMPENSSYLIRNAEIVLQSDKVIAFWTGKIHSGTFMTMNMAKARSKLYKVISYDGR